MKKKLTVEKTVSTNIVHQLQEDYLAYSMTVLTGRAIPDIFDGLRPATRRILQTMAEQGLTPDKPFVKCARICGMTTAWYHTHGSPYGSLIDMAAEWKNNVPWVWGHGNLGSSVDNAASERYVEAKLRPAAVDILLQDRSTWETRPNYDDSRREAIRFNAAVPTVLLNGVDGIGVGYATRVAPHSLRDIVNALTLAVRGDMKKARELLVPDFPTGCDLVKDEALTEYTRTGSGSLTCRAKIEHGLQKRDGRAKDRPTLTFTNLPPYTNPEKIGQQIKEGLERGRLENISEVIDESDLTGDRVVVVAKPGADVKLVEQQLYAYTDFETKFSAKTLVAQDTSLLELSPVDICARWFEWRLDRLEVKFRHELDLKEMRLEIVRGFLKAIDKIDAVIKIIRASASPKDALTTLITTRTLKFTVDQAKAILEMKLRQLTGLDREELLAEEQALIVEVAELTTLANDKKARTEWALKLASDLATRHGEKRRSALIEPPAGFTKVTTPGAPKRDQAPRVAKPRFMLVDSKKGVVTQAKGPRGALVLDQKDKVVFFTADGFLRKVPATFKGPIADAYTSVTLAKREAEVATRKYLCVFKLGEVLKAIVFEGESLCKVTSKGKAALPEGAELVHFDEKPYTVTFASKRKKPIELTLASVKLGKPGGAGTKVANLCDLAS